MNIWFLLPIVGGIIGSVIGNRAYQNYRKRYKS